MVLPDIVAGVWKCGGVESNSCCQVATVPVVLVKGTGLQNAVKHKDFVISLFCLPFM